MAGCLPRAAHGWRGGDAERSSVTGDLSRLAAPAPVPVSGATPVGFTLTG